MDVHPTKNVSIGIDPYPFLFPEIYWDAHPRPGTVSVWVEVDYAKKLRWPIIV